MPLTPAEIEQGNASNALAQMYFQQLFELRRRSPGDDLTTQLVQAEEDGSKLSNEELTANIILLFGAGHETTVNLIGNGLLALHRNPDQLALLKAHPELISNAIEEFLRYDSSVQLSGRVALEDIEDLGGKRIPKGESVLCLLGSANRDPAVYPDRPDQLDITRPNVRPLSFGGGIHFCLGAQLARIEAEVAISSLLRRLPVTIICDMLGIPEEHREVFYSSSRDGGRILDPVPLTPAEIAQGNASNAMAQMYFQQLFELRRKNPGDDLTTQLVQAEEDGSKLSNEELTANIILLFGAGHETTVNLIGNGLLALHRNPDQLALLKAHPELISNAIEEFLRYDSSVQLSGRVALEDIEDLGGKKIPKGESVLCLLGSANHDPAVYPDRPDSLDITRPNVRPLSFGGGIHHCLGAQLARIEAEVAIATLLRRLPELKLDDSVNPEWRPTFVLRGLKRLPASW
ncbi:MAG TPA: cytochrome P450 [Bradyrhizobium sp.]|nr:cytochrome P450 [Bradyrhizobium sp.]